MAHEQVKRLIETDGVESSNQSGTLEWTGLCGWSQQLWINDVECEWRCRVLEVFGLDEGCDAISATDSTQGYVEMAMGEWWFAQVHQHGLQLLALRLVVGHADRKSVGEGKGVSVRG